MEGIEAPAMVFAIVLIFGVVVAKVMITQLIGRMNRQISQVAQVRAEALNRLKMAEGQKSVVAKNQSLLNTKKSKISKKISRLKKEMAELKGEEQARRQRTDARKVG